MISLIIIIISLLLDGYLNNILPSFILSLFTPMLTLISVIIIYPLFKKNNKRYLITIFITGIVYDLLYTNLLFYNGVLFLLLGLLNIYINKKIQVNYLTIILIILLNIVVYILLNSLILYICNITNISIMKIIYVLTHSIILNFIYGYLLFIIVRRLSNKNKTRKLN